MRQALGAAGLVQWQGRELVEDPLLGLAQVGHQQQVVTQRIAGGQQSQAVGAIAEQLATRQEDEIGVDGRGFDFAGLEDLARHGRAP